MANIVSARILYLMEILAFVYQLKIWNLNVLLRAKVQQKRECVHTETFFSKCNSIKPKSDCIYHFPIDLEPNRRPLGSKSIGE